MGQGEMLTNYEFKCVFTGSVWCIFIKRGKVTTNTSKAAV